jgi:hypothetical protein
MSDLLLDAQERTQSLLKFGRWRLVFLSFSSLWMSWSGITNQLDLTILDKWAWFQAVGGCFGNWSILMASLLLTQGKAVASGHIPGLEEVDGPQPEITAK